MNKKRKIKIINENGKTKNFDSIKDCAEFLGVSNARVNYCTNRLNTKVNGYRVISPENKKNYRRNGKIQNKRQNPLYFKIAVTQQTRERLEQILSSEQFEYEIVRVQK